MKRFLVPLLAFLCSGPAAAADWSTVTTPAPGPTQSIGFYSAGCLQGAQALPLDGPGYEAIRISRNRYWGQPVMLDFIQTSPQKVRAAGQAPLYIGDIGQPRGGPGADRPCQPPDRPRCRHLVRAPARPAPAAGRPREPAPALAGERRATPASTMRSSRRSMCRCCGRRPQMPNLDRMFVNKFIKAAALPDRRRQPRLAEQARGVGRPRRAFPRPPALPARQPAMPAAGRLLPRRWLRRAARLWFTHPPVTLPPRGHADAALPAEAAGRLHRRAEARPDVRAQEPAAPARRPRHARVTFVELFFDLVFVFAVTQLSHGLLVHLTLLGAVETGLLMMAVWWVWIYTSWVTNWLDPEQRPVRLHAVRADGWRAWSCRPRSRRRSASAAWPSPAPSSSCRSGAACSCCGR